METTKERPDIGKWLNAGFEAFKLNWKPLVGMSGTYFGSVFVFLGLSFFLTFGGMALAAPFVETSPWVMILPLLLMPIPMLIFYYVLSVCLAGLFSGGLAAVRGQEVQLNKMFAVGIPRAVPSFLYLFLPSIAVMLPMIILIFTLSAGMVFVVGSNNSGAEEIFPILIPLVMFPLMFLSMAAFAIVLVLILYGFGLTVEGREPFFERYKISARVTKKNFWWHLLFFLILYALYAVGVYALLVGVVATLPLTVCCFAAAYNDLFPTED